MWVPQSVAEAVDSNLLHVLQTHWERQKVILRMIDDILMYMDRTFVQQKQLPSMYDAGLIIFRDMVIRHSHVRARLQQVRMCWFWLPAPCHFPHRLVTLVFQLLLANVHAERRVCFLWLRPGCCPHVFHAAVCVYSGRNDRRRPHACDPGHARPPRQ